MQIGKDHPREGERLELLRSYSILDSLPEKDYNNLTKLAAEICNSPISLITLLDDNRQWFKSHHGLDVGETPKEHAFCAHAINREDPIFTISDARLDERFRDNPLVTGHPNIVFYAGIPLKDASGLPLGTLCVIDREPRILTENQVEALKILAEQVMNLLELRKRKLDLEVAHAELKGFSDELEKRVRLRTAELESKNRKLEMLGAELETFVHISSHDLQEPLRKIQVFASQIDDSEYGNLSENGRYKLGRLLSAVGRMRNLIQDLMLFSAAKNKESKTVNMPLGELVEDTVNALREELRERGTSVKIEHHCNLDVVPSQFRQLLFNLFANSIKFSKANGPSTIKVGGQMVEPTQFPDFPLIRDSGYARITISDNGIGFEQRYAEQIFRIFQRLHGPEKYRGTGIGLAIVKRVVENHNGFFRVESVPGKGTKFEIFIPLET